MREDAFESSTPRKSTTGDGITSITVEKEKRSEVRYEPPSARAGPTLPQSQLSSLVDVLDMLDQGVVLLRSDLHPCYHNSAAAELLSADAQRDVLTQEVRAVSRVALGKGHTTAEREVGTA